MTLDVLVASEEGDMQHRLVMTNSQISKAPCLTALPCNFSVAIYDSLKLCIWCTYLIVISSPTTFSLSCPGQVWCNERLLNEQDCLLSLEFSGCLSSSNVVCRLWKVHMTLSRTVRRPTKNLSRKAALRQTGLLAHISKSVQMYWSLTPSTSGECEWPLDLVFNFLKGFT